MSEETTEVVTTETVTTNEPETEIEDDYKWLTERLDASTQEMRETRQAMLTALEQMREQTLNQSSELRSANQMLTELVQTMSSNLTAIAASVSLRSIPQTSETTSQTQPEMEQEVIVNPESAEVENRVPETPKRKRRIL